ncbi:SDR family NAD(P)-dependent oxidoreductase [Profundibacterium mesophilum]|uniref:C factor n=1 Tax=Profundibacterium mesophilum KAUST100406-0324 TaxID=1037889 RepID=A0A921TDC9_9RHOB|nr:SDR family NAD(P)-dependent oxidoreductase [Profundibacterium mesophilum]KAF0676663.1 C factor [Profundibacterium mesophilum KAUST100406-0324]
MSAGAPRALVIGASGGIGAALANALADPAGGAGSRFEVTRLSRREDGFEITDPRSVSRHLNALEGPYAAIFIATGRLAATGARPEKSLGAIDADAMTALFAVNAVGPALVLARLAPLLPRSERAVIGVLSARVGSIGDNRLGGWHSYRASKAALNQVIRGAAIELRRQRPGAILAALHPGTVETSFTADYTRDKLAPEEAARRLLAVCAGLRPEQTGGFFDHRGEVVPW